MKFEKLWFYDRHEVAKKISSLLKIVLFRSDNDTVLTGTNEGSSNPNVENKNLPPITKKNVKGVKHQIIKTIKYNPLKEESTSAFLRNKMYTLLVIISFRKFTDNKELLKMPRKQKKKNQIEEHNDFWDNQNLEESKRGSFDMVDFIESRFYYQEIYLLFKLYSLNTSVISISNKLKFVHIYIIEIENDTNKFKIEENEESFIKNKAQLKSKVDNSRQVVHILKI